MSRTAVEPRSNPWLIYAPARAAPKLRLVGFPHAGGGAWGLRQLFRDLPAEVEVLGMQLPGRENRLREPVSRNLPELLNGIVENLAPALDGGVPFVFFGHSLGALLAFETTRRFRAKRLRLPAALIVSARTPPHSPLVRPAMHGLADDDLLREVVRLEGIPRELLSNPEMVGLILPALRADLKLNETYVYSPEPPLDIPVLACGGQDDPEVPLNAMLEWRIHTRSQLDFKAFAGGHFYMYTSPAPFTSELSSFLRRVPQVRA